MDIKIETEYYSTKNTDNEKIKSIVSCFEKQSKSIDSEFNKLRSNEVLAKVRPMLEKLNFRCEGPNNKTISLAASNTLSFNVDAFSEEDGILIEIEGGRGIENYNLLRDLIEACVLDNINTLIVAVRKTYTYKASGKEITHNHFNTAKNYFDAAMSKKGFQEMIPGGVVLIGY